MQIYNNSEEETASLGEISGYMLLKLNINQVKLMSKCDLSVEDARYVALYEQYMTMRKQGDKVAYIISVLAERYGISESTVKRIVRRLSKRVSV